MRFSLLLSLALFACGGSKPATTTTTTTTTGPTAAGKILVNVNGDGVGLAGNDPVAYGTDNAPVAGAADNMSEHGGAKYLFAKPENKATFEGDKAKHAPQFGGYCAFAASQNRLSPADPTVFQVLEGQLLVFTNADYKERFNTDAAGNKAKADANWPGLVEKHGT